MGVKDCIIAARDRGALSKEEAQALTDEFDTRVAQHRLSMSDDVARAKARLDLEKALGAEAIEKRRRANLTEAARRRVKGYMQGYRGRDGAANVLEAAIGLLSHYGFRSTSSVRGRTEAIIAAAQAKLSDTMFAFERRGILGRRPNRALESDVVKELHGEASDDATAKALARSIGDVFEDLRKRFNAAGGAIGKLENFGLPHSHDRLRVKAAGRDAWKATIRGLVDPDRMINPVTGQPVGAAGLDQALDHVYDSIVSQNRAHMQPTMMRSGLGAIATQRQDERFLQFSDAASWLEYHQRFGRGSVTQAIFNHVNGMARDIASMEILGPNPAAMVEYLKQVVGHEIGLRETGRPSRAPDAKIFPASQARVAEYRIDALWQTLRGRPEVASGAAELTSNLKNLLTSAQLGSTAILAAATDPFVARAARKLAALPLTSTIGDMAKLIAKGKRQEAIRSGIIWEEYLHVMQDELRFAGPAVGSEWSRWLADRAVTWTGLKPLTTGRKLVEARAWQSTIADNAGKTFSRLDPRFRTVLEGFGVKQEHWEIWRSSVDPHGFVTAAEIERRGGPVRYLDLKTATLADAATERRALLHREAADKLSEVISSWSERSVPTGTPNMRSVVTGKAPRGTIPGELVDWLLQYKSFGLSFTAMQLEAIVEMGAARGGGKGWRTGLGYFAPLAIGLTLGGALYLQLKAALDGKKPESMDPRDNPGFWLKAGLQGGGFGLFGDFVKASENRFGQSPLEALAGPALNFVFGEGGVGQITVGNAMAFATGERTRFGRDLVRFARRYTPVIASHWATRGAYNRLVLDNLQWLLDPEADKSFKAQASQAKRNGTPYFVAPGAFAP